MKKALRIIVPILLAIAVIGCAVWYLFVYDREFTRDVLLKQARYLESNGYHTMAEWFYNTAYAHADNDETVAIELANQYKAGGNYTKAEYTLSNAIADGGTAELYMALCQTYVEQDKLLDAVNMLDNIADPAVKAQLDAMRPTAPVAAPEPGFYSQYISVELSSTGGTLYASIDGQYPSTGDVPYAEPITLEGGETTIYSLAVADNGLVSPLSIYGYTIGGVIEPVTLADEALDAQIRATLGVGEDKVLYTNELWAITSLVMPQDATTYADLEYLPYLQSLTIQGGLEEELHYIASLGQLTELHISNCSPSDSDMQIFASLPLLEKLTLNNCSLSSIESLGALQNLQYLDLSNNSIRNITALSSLANLQELIMKHNALSDLSALSGLSNLTKLDVSFNSLTTIAPICSMKSLTWLDVSENMLTELAAINNLTNLTNFYASSNALTDVSLLASCTAITELNVSSNALTDITALSTLNQLCYFYFSGNQVTALPQWDTSCALITIDGTSNLITDLEPLRGLENLNYVLMRFNTEITSVDPLADCPKLAEVDVWGSQVANADSLLHQSIIVTFDPTLGHPAAQTED